MSKHALVSPFLSLIFFASANVFAQTINIDFDLDPGAAPVAAGTNLVSDATYASLGVTFSRIGGGLCGPDVYANSNHPGDFGSLPNTVSTCTQGTASDINGPLHGQVQADFNFAAGQACIAVRPDSGTLAANLTAYDSGDQVVDSVTSTPGVNETICVNGADIRYIRFPGLGDTNTEYARFDDLSVTPEVQVNPMIELEMTLALDTNGITGDECGVSDTLIAGEGLAVEVCYTVTNTGDVALDFHDLEDTEFGAILAGFPFTLNPASSAFLTQTVVAAADTTFNGTWTAYNAGPTNLAESSDSAMLTVVPPSIELVMTITPDTTGVPGDECGAADSIEVESGDVVEVCYTVTNTGLTPLDFHDLEDSQFGTLLSGFALTLEPGNSVWLSQTMSAALETTFEGTWTAYNAGPLQVVQSSDSATVTVFVVPIPTLGWPALVLLIGLIGLITLVQVRKHPVALRGRT